MKRFITYMYEYERGIKGKNTGFIKVDIRGNDCRMELHLRTAGGFRGKGRVYVLVQGAKLVGLELAEMVMNSGRGDTGFRFRIDPIGNSGYGFEDIVGIAVTYGSGGLSASQWKDCEPIAFSLTDIFFRDGGGQPEAGTDDETGNAVPAKNENVASAKSESAAPAKSESAVPAKNENAVPAKTESTAQTENGDLPEPEEKPCACADFQPEMQEAAAKNDFPDTAALEFKWEELAGTHQAVALSSKNAGRWLRIELKELKDLPKCYWYLGNNSFLLHGFFNYHHILLGKEETEHGTEWYLGAPGVFLREERVMATLFGFGQFCPLEGAQNENAFGYWLHPLEKS